MNTLSAISWRRANRNDANEMTAIEQMRRDGLSPAERVAVAMDGAETPTLGGAGWNRRSDLLSAAPDILENRNGN